MRQDWPLRAGLTRCTIVRFDTLIEGVVTGRRRHRILLSHHEAIIVMPDYRHGYVRFQNHEYKVTWHPISKEVYVYWGTDKYAGKAYEMQEALDIALSWLNGHAR